MQPATKSQKATFSSIANTVFGAASSETVTNRKQKQQNKTNIHERQKYQPIMHKNRLNGICNKYICMCTMKDEDLFFLSTTCLYATDCSNVQFNEK